MLFQTRLLLQTKGCLLRRRPGDLVFLFSIVQVILCCGSSSCSDALWTAAFKGRGPGVGNQRPLSLTEAPWAPLLACFPLCRAKGQTHGLSKSSPNLTGNSVCLSWSEVECALNFCCLLWKPKGAKFWRNFALISSRIHCTHREMR